MLPLSDFDYTLPKELIAQYPLKERASCRLLVLNREKGAIEHCVFKDITDYLRTDDLLVLNDTKVLPARLIGRRHSGGKVEVLLLKQKAGLVFQALIRPARVKIGEEIVFNRHKITAQLSARKEIIFKAKDIEEVYSLGKMPLPPYIKREVEPSDDIYYQTVYAKRDGSIAAPTAGLHFSNALLRRIQARGTKICRLTLHVGQATFQSVECSNIAEHKMESEELFISGQTLRILSAAKAKKNRIIAVGTTALRAIESVADLVTGYACLPAGKAGGTPACRQGRGYAGSTDLFIYPGYKFKLACALLTNFHLPRTTLYILVCALAGEKLIRKAYAQAIEKKYRFYSYGDAMLII